MFTKEDLRKLILPLLFEQLLVVLVGMMDTIMVSSCGEAAVSGVSLVDSINVLLIQFLSALATGGAVVTSQFLGSGDLSRARLAARQLYYVVLAVSLLFTAICLAVHHSLLLLLFGSIEKDVMASAVSYFLMTALSFPFLAHYNASAALLRSMGRSSNTLSTSLVMNLVNIVGNAIAIFGFGMGAAGVGLATLLSRIVACVYITRYLKDPACQIPYPHFFPLQPQPELIRKVLAIGLPGGFENSLFQFGKLILVRMIAGFGTASIAANAVGNTIATFQVLPGSAVSLAMITVVGQCVGAHRMDQARSYTWRLMRLTYLLMSSLNILLVLLNPWICKPFHLSPETEAMARQVIMIHGLGSIFIWPLSFVLPNSLRAAGDARFTMLVSTLSMIFCRVALGYLFSMVMGMGLIGVWLAMQVDWVIRIACFLWRFFSGAWESKALV